VTGVRDLLLNHGLVLLFLLVAVESAGVPLPGETALITAGVLAAQGHYSIVTVIVVAATGAIVGDNVGYWLGRKGGRALLRRTPIVRNHFERALPPAERFFARHGAKTVFIARFVALLRVTSAWIAGISHMPWWKFLFWNATGGIVWAAVFGVLSYQFGLAAADAVSHYGLIGGIVVAVFVVLAAVALKLFGKRFSERRG
jgi:membrane protein DedA with SNARE-associated domain